MSSFNAITNNFQLLYSGSYSSENLRANKSYIPKEQYNFFFMTLDELKDYWNIMSEKFDKDDKQEKIKENKVFGRRGKSPYIDKH
jgi:hypothetical protein